MAIQNSVRSYLGIAKESTRGTVVAPTAYIPVAQSKLKPVDIIDPLYDDGLRGSNVVGRYNYVQGRSRSTFDFGGPVFADTIPWAIAGVLGQVDTTGSSAPYTHTISLENGSTTAADTQPTSFTLTDFYAANVRSYAGCMVHDFSLTFNADGLLEYDAKATGFPSATVSTPTPSFTTVTPTPVWQGTVSVGGTTIANAVSGKIDMKRAANAVYAINTTRAPYAIFVGGLEVTGELKFVMEDDARLTEFLNATLPAITVNWATGSGATATQIQATLTKGAYTTAVIDRGSDMVEVTITLTGIANTTDAGSTGGFAPIKWVVKNAVASGTYQ